MALANAEPVAARTVQGFCRAYGIGVTKTYALLGAGKLRAHLSEIIYPDQAVLAKERAILLFEQKDPVSEIYPRTWPKPKESPLF